MRIPAQPGLRRQRVLVVGGGPAGVAAATAASKAGYEVLLAEATGCLGGQLALVGHSMSHRDLWLRWIRWSERELEDGAVKVRLNTPVTADDCVGYDRVVIATGARPEKIPQRLAGRLVTLDAWAAIRRPSPLTGSVLVVDQEGEWAALEAAEVLATHGHAVTMVTAVTAVGSRLRRSEQKTYQRRLGNLSVQVLTLHELLDGGGTAPPQLRDNLSGKTYALHAQVGTVVIAARRASQSELWEKVQNWPGTVCAGDALSPRSFEVALAEGTQVIRTGHRAL
ncbi:FAD-dependent oxidoreductase [Streptomyces sp. 1222.5]|uniref:FAD-dependent oxidoreductase n=1 Tax=Streptomyces sp. 1222.5 TaxID=1881026 RepID=UPI003EBAFC53